MLEIGGNAFRVDVVAQFKGLGVAAVGEAAAAQVKPGGGFHPGVAFNMQCAVLNVYVKPSC